MSIVSVIHLIVDRKTVAPERGESLPKVEAAAGADERRIAVALSETQKPGLERLRAVTTRVVVCAPEKASTQSEAVFVMA